MPFSRKCLGHGYFNLIHSFTDFVFVFIQVIEIEILQDNWPVFKLIDSQRNKGKYHVKYIYFYNIKFTKYMKFTKFTILC